MTRGRRLALLLAALGWGGASSMPARAWAVPSARTAAAAPMTVTINAAHPGVMMPGDFVGLSFEAPVLGYPVLASPSSHLANLLRSLGPGQLRFAGDSLDRTQWLPAGTAPAPWARAALTATDLVHVAAVARTAGWRVLLGLNLGHPDPASAADEARTAASTLGPALGGLEIGNEPDRYTVALPEPFRFLSTAPLRPPGWRPPNYALEVAALSKAVAGASVHAPLYGPDTALTHYLAAFAPPGLSVLTDHIYPATHCLRGHVLIPGPSITHLLSRGVASYEGHALSHAMAVAGARRLPLRIDEANSVSCAGQPRTSDSFAAALWAIDFALRAASRGVRGVDFHGGLGPCLQGGHIQSPWYSPLCAAPTGALVPRPEYYGLLLLRLLEGSSVLPVAYRSPPGHHATVYAFRAGDGSVRAVIEDLDVSGSSRSLRPLEVTLALGPSYRAASMIRLTAPSLSATEGVRLGGAAVRDDGTFAGAASQPVRGGGGRFEVPVRAGSAALVTVTG